VWSARLGLPGGHQICILTMHRGVEQWQLVGLITRRSLVRIQPPLPSFRPISGRRSSVAEQGTHKPLVAGSNPAAATRKLACTSQKSRASRALFAWEALGVHPYLHPFGMQWFPRVLEEPVAALASPQWSTISTYLEPVLVPASARFSLCGRHYSPCLYGYAHTRYTPAAAHRSAVRVPREPTD